MGMDECQTIYTFIFEIVNASKDGMQTEQLDEPL